MKRDKIVGKIALILVVPSLLLTACRTTLGDTNKNSGKWPAGILVNGQDEPGTGKTDPTNGTSEENAESPDNTGNEDSENTSDPGNFSDSPTVVVNNGGKKNDNTSGQKQNNEEDTEPDEEKKEVVEVKNVPNVIRTEAEDLRLTEAVLNRSIANQGNMNRLAAVIRKAILGKPVTIAFIGGSITEGTGASSTSGRYADRFKSWWQQTFPDSALTYVNAGIGATDSLMGVHRVDNDILSKNPDLVVIDFSVNDTSSYANLYRESYESLIRKILKHSNHPAVICIAMFNESGGNVQSIHSKIAEHYDVPFVSYKDAVWPEGGTKLYAWSEIGVDNVHPNNTGHKIISELLIYYVNTVRAQIESIPETYPALPAPMTDAGFETGVLYNNTKITPTALGSFKVNNNAFRQFQQGWTVSGGTKPIEFKVSNAKSVYILYRRYTSGKGGTVDVSVDGKHVGFIDSDFYGGWGDNVWFYKALDVDDVGEHTVSLQLVGDEEKTDFALLGLMVA